MTDKPTIHQALSAVMAGVQSVRKDKRNPEHGYLFRGVDAVVNAVGPEMRKHGVFAVPELLDVAYRDVQTSRGKPSRECTVKVRYVFYGPAGDRVEAIVPGESMDYGDKGAAKAMSVAYRIALLQALCIPTDEPEHEPDAHTYERAERPPPSIRAAELFQEITDAKTSDELSGLWRDVNEAGKAGEISGVEAEQLKAHITKRSAGIETPSANPEPMVDQRQHKRMAVLWRDLGMGGEEHRDERLARTSAIVGRDLDSSAKLTHAEAVQVIRTLVAEVETLPNDEAAS